MSASSSAPSSAAPSPAATAAQDRVIGSTAAAPAAATRGKRLVRVRKDRAGAGGSGGGAAGIAAGDDDAAAAARYTAPVAVSRPFARAVRAAGAVYLALLALRLALVLAPGILEPAEGADGVQALAAALLPGIHRDVVARGPSASSSPGQMPEGMRPAVAKPPEDTARRNYTRSIVGAFLSSGLPYMVVNTACRKIPLVASTPLCAPAAVGHVAIYAPRFWMFALSILGDVMLVRVFAVYETEHATSALLTYASSWMALLIMNRNSNFVLEALCLLGLLCACFGWTYKTPRPLFLLSATALALGIFIRPVFAVFCATPLIYLVSLWGKPSVDPLRYVRSFLEGAAVFGLWFTLWVIVDSVFYGYFTLLVGDTPITSFDMFVDRALLYISGGTEAAGGRFSYKGSLVYTPLNAALPLLTKAFWGEMMRNTSPGQIFLHLPVVLGPLTILLIRESIEGLKAQAKELMSEMKSAAGDKKGKKRKARKSNMSKEREEELLVYFDTIQTTFLLGLLLEVMQSNDRIGVLSLVFLNALAVICLAAHVFGPTASPKAKIAHLGYTLVMVVFYGLMNHSGVTRMLLATGAGLVASVPPQADLVMYRAKMAHTTLALGANPKNVHVHNGGDDRLALMTTLRGIKSRKGYDEERLLVCAAGTIPMKDTEFELVDKLAFGHASLDDLPENIDSAFTQARLHVYKFTGDENEAIIRDEEEAADEEERERERRARKDEL